MSEPFVENGLNYTGSASTERTHVTNNEPHSEYHKLQVESKLLQNMLIIIVDTRLCCRIYLGFNLVDFEAAGPVPCVIDTSNGKYGLDGRNNYTGTYGLFSWVLLFS
jgi:hypothetical protein